MADKTKALEVVGKVRVLDPYVFESIIDGEDGRIYIERTDADEVAIHFMCGDDDRAITTIYTNCMGAFALAGLVYMEAAKEGFGG